jgi:peroxiredoxin
MAQTQQRKLDSGDLFPKMELKLTDGTPLVLPEMTKESWSVLLVYRGRW